MSTRLPVIVLDPGHGGSEPTGASAPNNAVGPNGLLEKDVVLDLARRVANELADRANVVLTRDGDENRSLQDRAQTAAENDAGLFASIHLNGSEDAQANGAEAWVARGADDRSRSLAQALVDAVRTAGGLADRGVREADFGVLLPDRHDPGTAACLLEISFLTNPAEAHRLADDDHKGRLARAIAEALASQLNGQAASAARALDAPPTPVVTAADSTLVRADRVIPADSCGVLVASGNYRERVPEKIVIHVLDDDGGYAVDIASWNEGRSCTPPHYVIRNDGEITQMVAEKYMAQHAGPHGNPTMIGIEHDGWDNDPSYFTEAMYLSSAALVRDICSRQGIPVDREHIIGHDEVRGSTHGDPGGYWDWDYYLALVRWNGADPSRRPLRHVVDATALSGPMPSSAWHTVDRDSGRADWRQRREAMGPLYYSGYGPRYVRAEGAADAPESDSVEFRFVTPGSGDWALSAWWPLLDDGNTASRFEVSVPTSSNPDLQLQSLVFDQRARWMRTRQTVALPASPTWCPLPMLSLQQYDEVKVRVLRRSDAPGKVIADAVRFLKI